MLSSVVLPAPLGPMTDIRAPWVTSRLTRLTACTPPKALDTSRISSNALISSAGGPGPPVRTSPLRSRRRSRRSKAPCPLVARDCSRQLTPCPLGVPPLPPRSGAPSAGVAGATLLGGRQSGQPSLPAPVVFDVTVRLALPHARHAQVEL